MRNEIDFVEMVVQKNSGISINQARLLYWSMALAVALFILGKRQNELARTDIDRLIKTLTKKINIDKLKSGKDLFLRLRNIEHEVKERARGKHSPHIIDRIVLENRVASYSEILKFTLGDAEKVEDFKKELDKLRESDGNTHHRTWKVGLSAASLAALSYGLYHLFRPPAGSTDRNKK